MEIINKLLSYQEIKNVWESSAKNSEASRILTLTQVEAFEKIIYDDEGWKFLLLAFNKGREIDAWLAMDWPNGFDELLLCVPLCKLVDFECSKCTIGKRQKNNSCAHDFSVFGYIAELLKIADRDGLKKHIKDVEKMLTNEKYKWNMISHSIEN
jgi:hypothetical protein